MLGDVKLSEIARLHGKLNIQETTLVTPQLQKFEGTQQQ